MSGAAADVFATPEFLNRQFRALLNSQHLCRHFGPFHHGLTDLQRLFVTGDSQDAIEFQLVACGGGLTTIASAWLMEPEIASRLTLVWIGGNEHPALASPPPGALEVEYNASIDPVATGAVFNDSDLDVWQVPRDAYWDAQTARAVENFPISGMRPLPLFVWATALVKWATARTNTELEILPPEIGRAIMQAAEEVMAGELADQFVVDVFQAGAGTSHHMNVNEVLASRACELLGGERGDFSRVHPNDHVNFGQSTNDVIPTAIRLGALHQGRELLAVLDGLREALEAKAGEFDDILKSGRTHLQDAVPVRLGQEFAAWAVTIGRWRDDLAEARQACRPLGIGGSATGTGLNTDPRYAEKVCGALSERQGEPVVPAADRHEISSMHPESPQPSYSANTLATPAFSSRSRNTGPRLVIRRTASSS